MAATIEERTASWDDDFALSITGLLLALGAGMALIAVARKHRLASA